MANNSKTAAPLLDLPYELLRPIVQDLSQRDTWALSLTSKALHNHLESFLYSSIRWDWSWDDQTKTKWPSIALLARTLCQRPDLGRHIRSFALVGDILDDEIEWPQIPDELPAPCLPEDDLQKLVAHVSFKTPFTRRWGSAMRHGKVDAYIALILKHTPHLKTLHLGSKVCKELTILGGFLRQALSRNSAVYRSEDRGFRQLEEVYLKAPAPTERIDLYIERGNMPDVAPLLYLESLKHLTLTMDHCNGLIWSFHTPPRDHGLKTLDLSNLREGELGKLLSVFSGVETLRWQWNYSEFSHDAGGPHNIKGGQILADLGHVRQSLKHLTIEARCFHDYPVLPPLRTEGVPMSFTQFEKLLTLSVPMHFLLADYDSDDSSMIADQLRRRLPHSLEFLTITDHLYAHDECFFSEDCFAEGIRSWLQDLKSTPRLRGFGRERHGEEPGTQAQELEEHKTYLTMTREAGLEFRHTSVNEWPRTY